ncbi:MAG: HDOD domain-containing protein [Planctomycetota bacterium]|nr:HDOD domain-containing protein [Planctomycetota bacterium]
MSGNDASQARHIELILRQIDSLPTLPVVATRLLSLTASDESSARDIMEVVSADQALTAKILALCKQSDRGVRTDVMSVDKAVVLLGFNAIRNAVLSVQVVGMFDRPEPDGANKPGASGTGKPNDAGHFDRTAFWRHSLAVAITAEFIAAAHPGSADLPPSEAFVCGLLHDIGKLAIDYVLPKSFSRILELADLNQGNISEFERRIVGIDHHTAGKRLAEQWGLPHRLQDCIWLHGSNYETLPRLDHRRMVGVVGLADLMVRRAHIGFSGNHVLKQDPQELARKIGLDASRLDSIGQRVHEELERRSKALGLDDKASRDLFIQSIQQANQALGRLNAALDRRGAMASRQAQILEAVTAFHSGATPGSGVPDVVNSVAVSAAGVLGGGFYAVVCPGDKSDERTRAWLISQFSDQGKPMRSHLIEPPPEAPDIMSVDLHQPAAMNLMGILPWISDHLEGAPDLRSIKMLPLSCGWGTAAILLHDRPMLPPWQMLAPLAATWGSAIAAAAQHDGARRLGEDLAESNRALAEAQDRLLRNESLTRLGEMAAGAAHEMNNPLAVISGRAQLLAGTLPVNSREQKAAQTVCEQAHRLSDLITSLRLYADPPKAVRQQTDMGILLDEALKRVAREVRETRDGGKGAPVDLKIKSKLPVVRLDPDQISQAIAELILNAVQAQPKTGVQVIVQADKTAKQLTIQVVDDGVGMDGHTLAHAMDPFFSSKPAGRRIGMGLPRAQQLVSTHSGWIQLRSAPGVGTTATLTLPLDPEA